MARTLHDLLTAFGAGRPASDYGGGSRVTKPRVGEVLHQMRLGAYRIPRRTRQGVRPVSGSSPLLAAGDRTWSAARVPPPPRWLRGLMKLSTMALAAALAALGCDKDNQPLAGPAGARGPQGAPGAMGKDGAPGKDSAASGTRLTARYFVADDGARIFSGWHDTMLDTDCAFMVASDGKTRCLPSGAHTVADSSNLSSTDPTCAAPASFFHFVTACAAPVPAFVIQHVVQPQLGCSPPPATDTAFAVGALQTAPATLYYQDAGTCTAVSTGPGQLFYAITVVDPASLVSGAVQ